MILNFPCTIPLGWVPCTQTICNGGGPSGSSPVINFGGGGVLSYRWEHNIGTGSWTAIAGAIIALYDHPAGLSVTPRYRRPPFSVPIGSGWESISTFTVNVTVQATVTPGSIDADQTTCPGGDPAVFSFDPPKDLM
jgi:hypothetical protein